MQNVATSIFYARLFAGIYDVATGILLSSTYLYLPTYRIVSSSLSLCISSLSLSFFRSPRVPLDPHPFPHSLSHFLSLSFLPSLTEKLQPICSPFSPFRAFATFLSRAPRKPSRVSPCFLSPFLVRKTDINFFSLQRRFFAPVRQFSTYLSCIFNEKRTTSPSIPPNSTYTMSLPMST